jgi:polyribonucleotide nucleotidyltransferase
MFKVISKEIEWAGSKLKLETGKIARQSDGAVVVTYGDTVVLCTVVSDKKKKDGIDFLPLTVHYKEMFFAAGKIPGGFFKREGRASEKEVLVSRLIDRPIRPLFADNYYHETQVICTVLSFDNIHDSDILALIGAAAALEISHVPFAGPLAAAKVGYKDGQYILNPKLSYFVSENELDLVVAGTSDSVLMVESEARMLSEEVMLGAVNFGHQQIKPVLEMISQFAKEVNTTKAEILSVDSSKIDQELQNIIEHVLKEAYQETDKQIRVIKIDAAKKQSVAVLMDMGAQEADINIAFKKLQQKIVRRQIVDHGKRIDGRKINQIRPINCEVSFLPRVHGSALFTRGETQVIAGLTLGAGSDEQAIDSLEGESKQSFMLHYNFPPYSVGEATPSKAPGRREIGHGKLAWRAIHPIMPSKIEFPYTVRIVSEVTESNGSSSMATVCGGILSLMDAGVPIKSPVAGIAMGLILEKDKYVVLSDILGDEDHLGDMDFKVAGTKDGITALQMDIKIKGISSEIMQNALNQAKEGRIHILSEMDRALNTPREKLNEYAPSIITITINKDKIRELIGPGGKVIKAICEESKAKIDIDDNGVVKISSLGLENGIKAQKMVEAIVLDPIVNQIYSGKIVKIMEFGAFVNIASGKDGFLHVSEISHDKVSDISKVLQEGQEVWVKVTGFDNRGKIKLSMKVVNQENGENTASNDSSSENKLVKKNNSEPEKKSGAKQQGRRYNNSNRSNMDEANNEKSSDGPSSPKTEKRKYFG